MAYSVISYHFVFILLVVVSHRNLAKHSTIDAQRRLHLLRQASEELQNKKSNLQETISIANSLCCIENEVDAEVNINNYMLLLNYLQ